MNKSFAFFAISTQLGGSEKSLLDFLAEFSKKQSSICVFTPKKTGPLIDELDKLNIPHQSLDLPSFVLSLSRKKPFLSSLLFLPSFFYSFYYIFKIHRSIKPYSVVHSTGLKFHMLLCLTSLLNPQKNIYIHLRDIISWPLIKNFFYLFKNQKNIHFISNSKATAQALPKITSDVVHNGFDDSLFSPGESSLKERFSIPDDELLIGVVAVVARWKGQREFLEMASQLLKQYKKIHFIVVGNEIYDTVGERGELAWLKKKTQQYQITDNVHFMDFQKDITDVYRGLDILVHSSIKPEPFGRVIVEAMLCGCPVIAANQGGPLEIIEHTKTGFLYEQASIPEMSASLKTLIEQKPLRKDIGLAARKRGLHFSLSSYAHSLGSILLKN